LVPQVFAQDQTETTDDATDNPTGVTGVFNGNITTGGSYDPYTRNARREVTDIVVPGSVGAYPLKFTRTYNSRDGEIIGMSSLGRGWRYSYGWTHSASGGCDFMYCPDGRSIGHCDTGGGNDSGSTYVAPPIEEADDGQGNWVLADGGKVHLGYDWECSDGLCPLHSGRSDH
jgi:hypothetical protein